MRSGEPVTLAHLSGRSCTRFAAKTEPRLMRREGAFRLVFAWAYALALGGAAWWPLSAALHHKLWLDDLYTLALVKAPTLGHLFHAVELGIDGNPPLYMTLAWGLAHVPIGWSVEAKLLALNAGIGAAVLAVLFQIARRFIGFSGALAAIALLLLTNENLIEPLLHLRTYPLFLLFAAASALFQLRLLDSHSRADAILLACCYCALTMSHTFGIVYACMIAGGAALAIALNRGIRAALACLYPAVPALLLFAAWLPVLARQSTVGHPYGWMQRPAWFDLVLTATPGGSAAVAGVLMLVGIVLLGTFGAWTAGARGYFRTNLDLKFQSALFTLAMFLGFVAAVWVFSQAAFPIFVARYFTPTLMVYFAATTAFVGLAFRLLDERPQWVVSAVIMGLSTLAVASATPFGTLPCFDRESQTFIEQKPGLLDPNLPLVAVSPHSWFPRVYYAPSPAAYIFPLDWDVVLKFPYRARSNAVDFNIMERFQAWASVPNIVTTDALVRLHNEFYVVNEDTRGWLDNLRLDHAISETVLVTSGNCSLVRVRVTPSS